MNSKESLFDIISKSFQEILDSSTMMELNKNRKIYITPFSTLLQGLNENIVCHHIQNRFVDLTRKFENFDPLSTDSIILAKSGEIYYILDGQHRIEYLKSRFQHHHINIMLDVRICENNGEIMRQLKIINDRRIMEVKEESDQMKKYSEFFEKFQKNNHFSAIIKRNRPYVSADTLQNVIIQSDFFRSTNTSGTDVFNKIVSINNFFSTLDSSKLSVDSKVDPFNVIKAKEMRYYLTFDKEYYPIRELIDFEPSTFEAKWNDFLTKRRKRKIVIK